MTDGTPIWTYGQPRPLGWVDSGRKAYQGIFRMHRDGIHFVEHVIFLCNRPSKAMRTIAADPAPARFAHAHFDDSGTLLPKNAKTEGR